MNRPDGKSNDFDHDSRRGGRNRTEHVHCCDWLIIWNSDIILCSFINPIPLKNSGCRYCSGVWDLLKDSIAFLKMKIDCSVTEIFGVAPSKPVLHIGWLAPNLWGMTLSQCSVRNGTRSVEPVLVMVMELHCCMRGGIKSIRWFRQANWIPSLGNGLILWWPALNHHLSWTLFDKSGVITFKARPCGTDLFLDWNNGLCSSIFTFYPELPSWQLKYVYICGRKIDIIYGKYVSIIVIHRTIQ
jgi:hypothetical protein